MKVVPVAQPGAPKLPNASPRNTTRDAAVAKLQSMMEANAAQPAPAPKAEDIQVVTKPPLYRDKSPAEYTSDSVSSEQPKAEPKVSEAPLSSQHAILARKERAIRQREQQLRAKEAELRSKEEAKAAPVPSAFDESKYVPKDRLMKNAFEVLGELGLSYDQLTEMAMNAPKPEQMALMNEIRTLKADLDAIKNESESTKKNFEEQQTQQRQQAERQIRADVRSLVQSSPEFETIRETGNMGEVVKLIVDTFDKDGILLTAEEAAFEVENHLVEEIAKHARIKKIQQKLQPQAPRNEAPKKTAEDSKQPQLKTLTNSVSSTRKLSTRERAMLAFKGELKD